MQPGPNKTSKQINQLTKQTQMKIYKYICAVSDQVTKHSYEHMFIINKQIHFISNKK